MKTRGIIFLCVLTTILLCFPTGARAEWFSFDEIMMVGTNASADPLSRVEKTEFGLDETPFLYLKLPENITDGLLSDYSLTGSTWTGPLDFPLPGGLALTNSREQWISLPYWDLVKEPGQWNVDAAYFYINGGMKGKGSTSFSVSPEPVSTVLFLAGGGIFAAALTRKRKYA